MNRVFFHCCGSLSLLLLSLVVVVPSCASAAAAACILKHNNREPAPLSPLEILAVHRSEDVEELCNQGVLASHPTSTALGLRGGARAPPTSSRRGLDSNKKTLKDIIETPAVAFHLVFALAAVIGVTIDVGTLGNRILALVVGYNVALPLMAKRNNNREWLDLWHQLVPLSALMVIPDIFQVDYQKVLVYPDTGGPFIGSVSLAMAGMWTIALFPVTLLGRHVDRESTKGDGDNKHMGLVAVAFSGLALFVAAEANSWRLPIWETQNCRQWGRMAYFPIPAETLLAVTTYAASFVLESKPFVSKGVTAVLLMLLYAGTAAISFLFTDVLYPRTPSMT